MILYYVFEIIIKHVFISLNDNLNIDTKDISLHGCTFYEIFNVFFINRLYYMNVTRIKTNYGFYF